MRAYRFAANLALLFTSATLLAQAPAPPLDPRVLINDAVKDVMSSDPSLRFIKVGSHVSGKNYRNPLTALADPSDHDFRMVLNDPDGTKDAVAAFQRVRGELAGKVKSRLKGLSDAEVTRVMESINLYPPESVGKTLQTSKEAAVFFDQINARPNLGGRSVEGVFGSNSTTWVHHYEEKAGRLMYVDARGRVVEGMTDLLHRAEEDGFATFTAEGCANLAGQFADKGREAVQKLEAKTLLKDLTRMRTALAKSQGLARVPIATAELDALTQKVANIVASAKDEASLALAMRSMSGEVQQVLQKTSTDARILRAMSETKSPVTRAFYRKLLSPTGGAWGRMKAAFWEGLPSVGDVAGHVLVWGQAVQGVYAIATSESDADRVRELAKAALSVLAGGAYLPAELTDMMLQAVAEEGIAAGARAQDCLNLTAGIYSPWGVAVVSDDTSISLQGQDIPAQLATRFPDTPDALAELKTLVHRHAERAGNLHQNPDPTFRQKLVNAIEQQCLPQILNARTNARLERIEQINQLVRAVDASLLGAEAVLTVRNAPDFRITVPSAAAPEARGPVVIQGGLTTSMAAVNRNLSEIRRRVLELEGGKGQPISFDWSFQMRFAGPSGQNPQSGRDIFNYLASSVPDSVERQFRLAGLGSYTASWEGQLTLTNIAYSRDLSSDLSALPQQSKTYPLRSALELEVEEGRPQLTLTITPSMLQGEPNKEYSFAATGVALPDRARVVWTLGDSDLRQDSSSATGGKFTRSHTYLQAGTYDVKAMLIDANRSVVATATARVVISATPAPGDNPGKASDNLCAGILEDASAAGMLPVKYYRAERAKYPPDPSGKPTAAPMTLVLCSCPVNVSDGELLACLKSEPVVEIEKNPCAGFTVADFKRSSANIAFIKCAIKCGPISNPDGTPTGPPLSDAELQACIDGVKATPPKPPPPKKQ